MALPAPTIADAIDNAPYNMGVKGMDWLRNPLNVPVSFDNGDVVIFDHMEGFVWQIHVLLKSRGRQAIQNIKESIRRMFDYYGAKMIMGLAPDFRRDVKIMARWVGFHSAGIKQTGGGPCEMFVLSRDMWKAA